MSKKNDSQQQIVSVGDVPAHLLALMGEVDGAETMKAVANHRVLNVMAIIQSNSPREKKEKWGEGSAVVPTTGAIVARANTPVTIVPIFVFEEFIKWADRKDPKQMIIEQTIDRNSRLAAKCMNKATWKEPYGDGEPKLIATNRHHFNFVCAVYSGEMRGQHVVLSCAGGNWPAGSALIGAINARRIGGKQAPCYSTVWTATVIPKRNRGGDEYFGWEIKPADSPWVSDPDDLASLKAAHEGIRADYDQRLLAVGHEAGASVEGDEEESVREEKRF